MRSLRTVSVLVGPAKHHLVHLQKISKAHPMVEAALERKQRDTKKKKEKGGARRNDTSILKNFIMSRKECSKGHSGKHHTRPCLCPPLLTLPPLVPSPPTQLAFGEFIRTFTLSAGPTLPIVQPGAPLPLGNPTVPPVGVNQVENGTQVGVLVPRGTYLVSWTLRIDVGAQVSLQVNGVVPTDSAGYQVGTSVVQPDQGVVYPVQRQLLVRATQANNNLISLVNTGTTLFGLSPIPNSQIGATSLITQFRVQQLST